MNTHPLHDLAPSDSLYRLLIEGIKDYAIFLLDLHGTIVSWNAGAECIKGYAAHEVVGRHFSLLYPPELRAKGLPERELEIALMLGRVEDEGWRLRKDGSLFWADVVLTALRGADGRLVGFAKITRDLTERKQAEDALLAAKAEAEAATAHVHRLKGLLPICSYCKRIRDDKAYWHEVETYIGSHADVQFTHSICPGCFQSRVQPELDALGGDSCA